MNHHVPPYHAGRAAAAVLLALAGLAACGDQGAERSRPGQALVSVNGQEITLMQLNEELQRANVSPAQQDAASKQLLKVLVDRQLLHNEALKEKLDRDPKVMQAIERAKALIVAQAYMQKKLGLQARPGPAEIADYYARHPAQFSQRKQFVLNQLLIATRDLTPQAQLAANASKSLDEMAGWFDARQVQYARSQVTRSSTELAPELSARLLGMKKGQLFAVREGERSLLMAVGEVREAPLALADASAQIEQFLSNKHNREAAEAELARLRAGARIAYLNKAMMLPAGAADAGLAAPAADVPAGAAGAVLDRGVAGLK